MTTRQFIIPALLLAATTLNSAGASAQTADAAAQPLGGPVVAGLCLLSREAIFANAAVGRAASVRLAELTTAAQTEIDRQRATLETEISALEGQGDSPARAALAQRWQALQRQATHDSAEIDATRAAVLERIANEAQPVIAQAYTAKNCGLLFDRTSALGGNFANDLTADVVSLLDARIQTITIERERLPQQAATG